MFLVVIIHRNESEDFYNVDHISEAEALVDDKRDEDDTVVGWEVYERTNGLPEILRFGHYED